MGALYGSWSDTKAIRPALVSMVPLHQFVLDRHCGENALSGDATHTAVQGGRTVIIGSALWLGR